MKSYPDNKAPAKPKPELKSETLVLADQNSPQHEIPPSPGNDLDLATLKAMGFRICEVLQQPEPTPETPRATPRVEWRSPWGESLHDFICAGPGDYETEAEAREAAPRVSSCTRGVSFMVFWALRSKCVVQFNPQRDSAGRMMASASIRRWLEDEPLVQADSHFGPAHALATAICRFQAGPAAVYSAEVEP